MNPNPRRSALLAIIFVALLLVLATFSGDIRLNLVFGLIPVFTTSTPRGIVLLLGISGLLISLVLSSWGRELAGELPPEDRAGPRWHPEWGQVDPRDISEELELQTVQPEMTGVVFLGPIPIPLGMGWKMWMWILGGIILLVMILPAFF